jgi:hypothetical protein
MKKTPEDFYDKILREVTKELNEKYDIKNMNKNTEKGLTKYLDSFYWYDRSEDALCASYSKYELRPEYPSEYQILFGSAPHISLRIVDKRLPTSKMKDVEKYLDSLGFLVFRRSYHSYAYFHKEKRILISGDCSEDSKKSNIENFGGVKDEYSPGDEDDMRETRIDPDDLYISLLPTKSNREFIEKIIKTLFKNLVDLGREDSKFFIIAQNRQGLFTKRTNFKALPVKDDRFDLFYGSKFPHEKIKKFVTGETENLMLLHGDPGTGKSNYIKHLITNSEKKVIYIPPSMLEVISSPGFITFMMENANSILLIEDAEEVLSTHRNSATNNLLGLTDGFLKDSLGLKVIATFNCDVGEIDAALMRKGRLYYEYKFDKLKEDECQKLLDYLGRNDIVAKGDKTLAELFNPEENKASHISEKRSMGFSFINE